MALVAVAPVCSRPVPRLLLIIGRRFALWGASERLSGRELRVAVPIDIDSTGSLPHQATWCRLQVVGQQAHAVGSNAGEGWMVAPRVQHLVMFQHLEKVNRRKDFWLGLSQSHVNLKKS